MMSLSARRLVPTCVLSAAAVAALAAPGVTSAAIGKQCSGANIAGQGSSLQKLAQELWDPSFNTSADKYSCNGTQGTKQVPKIEPYNPSGSGAGLRSFGAESKEAKEINFSTTNAYVGTDEPPNETQKTEIESQQVIEPHLEKTLQTVPVIQAAVAMLVHLPEGCTGTSTSNSGRLVLNNSTLEEIFRGAIKTWHEVIVTEEGHKNSADKITCKVKAEEESKITRVVREDGSGTTHIFKKYLGLINPAEEFEAVNGKGEVVGKRTWDGISEGKENTTWPKGETTVERAAKGSGVVAKVATTASSIGYANVADARANAAFKPEGKGGPKTAIFWAPVQDKAGEKVAYADPASNKEVNALGESNCSGELYTNGKEAFPPVSVTEAWNTVTTSTTESKYTICGLSYDLAFTKYSQYPKTSLEEATTVENFLSFVVDTNKEKEGNKANGGQTLIKTHDYEPLVGKVLTEAQTGVRGVKGKGGTEF